MSQETTLERGPQLTKFELALGSFFLRLTKPIASSFIWMLTYRSRRLRASQERQRLLAAFWKEEQERLWPMLRGSFEKVPHNWDEWHQLYAFAQKMQSCGMTVNQVNEALSVSGHKLGCDGKVFYPPIPTNSTIIYAWK